MSVSKKPTIVSLITDYLKSYADIDIPYSNVVRDVGPQLAGLYGISQKKAEAVLRNNLVNIKSRGILGGGRGFVRYSGDGNTIPINAAVRPTRSYGFDISADPYWNSLDGNPVGQYVALLIGQYPPIDGVLKEYFGLKPEWAEQSKLHAVQTAAEIVTGTQRTQGSVPDYVFQGLIKLMGFDHGRYMKKFAEAVEEESLNYLNVLEEISDSGDGAIPRIIHGQKNFRRRR